MDLLNDLRVKELLAAAESAKSLKREFMAKGVGWSEVEEALEGMRVGGKRRLLVPPSAIPSTQVAKVPGEERVHTYLLIICNNQQTMTNTEGRAGVFLIL